MPLIWGVMAVLCAPRIFYLLSELPLPYNFVFPFMDDESHVPFLVSMTMGDHYPLRHPFNPHELLSYYYAGYYPWAVLRMLLPFLSIETVIFFGQLFYQLAFAISMVEVSSRIFRRPNTAFIFLIIFLLFGGFAFLPDVYWRHEGWLAVHLWWNGLQIKPFFNGLITEIHHIAAFFSALLAWFFAVKTTFVRRWLKVAVCSLLLAATFYMSVFVFMSCCFFLIPMLRRLVPVLLRNIPPLAVTALLCVPPLWVFLGKPSHVGFRLNQYQLGITHIFWLDRVLSFVPWFVMTSVVDMAGLPIAMLLLWKRFSPAEKCFALPALGYFIFLYFVEFSSYNNLSMYGMFLPIFAMAVLLMRQWEGMPSLRLWPPRNVASLTVVLLLLSISGTVADYAALLIDQASQWSPLVRFVAQYRQGNMTTRIANITDWMRKNHVDPNALRHDRSIIVFRGDPPLSYSERFIFEKYLDIPISEMVLWETDLLGKPHGRPDDLKS